MTFLGMVEEKVYCGYDGEHSQRHPESRVNLASRLNQAMWAGKWGEPEAKRPEDEE